MNNLKTIGTYVYWKSGRFIGRKRVVIDRDDNTKGTIINDGRRAELLDGRWVVNDDD